MSEKEVVVNYDTLFELLRLEKNREDLQKLEPSFFEDVLEYLREKYKLLEVHTPQKSLFEPNENEKVRIELENISKVIKNLYERREKKIVQLALSKVRTGIDLVNVQNMLPVEKTFFDSLNSLFTYFRRRILLRLICGKIPEEIQEIYKEIPDINQLDDPDNRQKTKPKELKTNLNFAKESIKENIKNNTKTIKLLSAIEEVVGPDLQIYGPYTIGTIAAVPSELAVALINKNQAEES